MRTTEYPAYSIRELISSQKTVWLDDFALCVYPLGLYGVEPRTLLGQQASNDPHPFLLALFERSVVRADPASDFPGDVPAGVVPDENHNLLTCRLEFLQAPLKELGRYGAHGPSVNEAQPRIADLWQVESVAGDGFGLGVVFGDRLLDEAKGLSFLAPSA